MCRRETLMDDIDRESERNERVQKSRSLLFCFFLPFSVLFLRLLPLHHHLHYPFSFPLLLPLFLTFHVLVVVNFVPNATSQFHLLNFFAFHYKFPHLFDTCDKTFCAFVLSQRTWIIVQVNKVYIHNTYLLMRCKLM